MAIRVLIALLSNFGLLISVVAALGELAVVARRQSCLVVGDF